MSIAAKMVRPITSERASSFGRCMASAAEARSWGSSSRTRHFAPSLPFPSHGPLIPQYPLLLRSELRIHLSTSRSATTTRRTYGTDADTNTNPMQGTIGKGASVVGEEAQTVRESLQVPDNLDEKERMIFEKLKTELEPVKLEVRDISGGCGSMYGIEIVSKRFRGLSMLKQQRLVNEVLGEEIKGWHGVQLKTMAP